VIIARRVGRLLRSPSLLPMVVFGASGGMFALANLLLARRLPEQEYAVFTLVLALMNLGGPLATVGLDAVATRRPLGFGYSLLTRALLASSPVAVIMGIVAALYRVDPWSVLMVVLASAAGAAALIPAAERQRRHEFGRSLALVHSPNLVLGLAAALTLALDIRDAGPPLAILTAGFVGTAVAGWAPLLRQTPGTAAAPIPWREALSLSGTNASGTLLSQLDRLIVPHLLPLSALATYGALSAVVGSLFRVLMRGVGYALLPRLRAAASVRQRRRLVAGEARVVAVIALGGSLLLWFATPVVERWLLAGKYDFPPALVLATIVAGLAKLLTGFSRATVTALADARELAWVNLSGWLSVALAIAAAVAGARWGLAGVIYGVGLGWFLRAAIALGITARHLRSDPVEAAVASPR
jgi:O-antigen/teichoic acid export membrane protein